MVCPNCSANNDSTAAFCYNCGARLEQPTAAVGSPTIRVRPDEQPFAAPPTISPPQQPFGVPPAQLPASPYSTQQLNMPAVVPNSTAAIISLVFGIISWFMLPVIGAIVAVVAGHMARGEIRRSNGAIGGGGMATAGLILGYINIVVMLLGICAFIVFVVGLAGMSSVSP